MKKLFVVVLLALLVGCGNGDFVEEVESHMSKMKTHAETRTDLESYINDLKAFNEYLKSVDDEKYEEYVEAQLKANKTRIEAIETKDADLITESSFQQANALDIYENLKESE